MYKGIFWIVDKDDLAKNDDYIFLIKVNDVGNVIDAENELTSKNKDNYNHKNTRLSLPKNLTNNKDYNYYPRGGVEIKNNKLYINPTLIQDKIITYIKTKFNLNNNTLKILIIADNNNHYQSKV